MHSKLRQQLDTIISNFKSGYEGIESAEDIQDIEGIEVVIESEAIDKSFDDIENEDEIELIKGHKMSKNPGKLILGKQQFVANRCVPSEKGKRWYYSCARKHEGKGKGKGASCSAQAIIDIDLLHEDLKVVKKPKVTDHNHVCDEARVIKWRIQQEMEKRILQNVSSKVSIVRKQVIVEYSEKYKEISGVWQEVQALLVEDTSLDHRLYDFQQRAWGNIPRSRDAIVTERILERLEEVGGQNVKVLDSNEMWEDPTFRARFSEEIQAKGPPPRAMLFTADKLLEQLTVSEKWAFDGTHRVCPQHFSQMFLTMMNVGEKWLPAVLGLLPDHEGESYALYIKMILHSLAQRGLHHRVSSVLSDFELGIQKAISECLPGVEIRGCRLVLIHQCSKLIH